MNRGKIDKSQSESSSDSLEQVEGDGCEGSWTGERAMGMKSGDSLRGLINLSKLTATVCATFFPFFLDTDDTEELRFPFLPWF